MSSPRNDPIPNQDSTIIINEQDPILPPLLVKYPTGYKSLFNDTNYPNKSEDDLNDSTDNSFTDIDNYLNKLNEKRMSILMTNTKMIVQKLLKVMKF